MNTHFSFIVVKPYVCVGTCTDPTETDEIIRSKVIGHISHVCILFNRMKETYKPG
jgi:hypothetical protein